MEDQDKTKKQLIAELAELRGRIAGLQRASREGETGTSLLLEAASLGIHECDAEGRVTFVNPSAERIAGYTAGELVGTHVWDRIEPGPRKESLPAYLKHLVSEQPPPTPYMARNIKKNGELYDIRVDWNYRRNPQGKVVGFVCIVSDVTEQKRAETALRESEERYRRLTESTTDLIYIMDREGAVLYANPKAVAVVGLDANSIVGKRQTELFPPPIARQHIESVARVFETGETVETEGPYHYGSGEHWLINRFMPLRSEDGRVISVMGVFRSVTNRKRAEAALQESEERFRRVFEDGPLGVTLLGPDVRIEHCNRRFCEMLGYSEAEIIALGPAGMTHPDDWERNRRFLSRLFHGEIPQFTLEKRYVRKDGTTFWGQLTASMMHAAEGRPAAVIGMVEDVAERKRAEAALRESERTLRTLMDASPESVVLVDTQGTFLLANETAAHRLRKTVDQIVGRKLHDMLPSEVAANRLKHIEEVVRTGKPIRFEDERFGRYVENVMYPVIGEEGKVAAVAALGIDQTDRRRAEEALKEAHDELERRVEQRTSELAEANKQLRGEIEERKRIETALRQSEDRYRALIEASPDAVLMTDLERNIIFASQRSAEMFGYESGEDLCKQKATALVVEEERQRLTANISLLVRQGIRQQTEYIGVRSDGARFAGEVSSAVLRDDRGEPKAFMAVIRDITARKRAEQALVESEAKYRQMVEITDTGYAILDAQGRIVDANAEYVRLSGHHAVEEVLGRSVVEWTAPYDRERNATEVEKCLEKGQVRQLEIDYVHPDGRVTPVEINAGCVDIQQGKRILALHRDISERRQAQAVLERERQTLKHLLQSSDHERQLIAYEIHDGLAQYLAGSLMQFDVYNNLKETKPKEARKAYDAGMTMLRQSHADARRLISGVRPPILDEEGIVAAISHLVNEHRHQAGSKIEFHAEVKSGRLVPILENAVYRIAQEALMNACKHGKSERIRVELVQHDDTLRIKVQDWGAGFNPREVAEDRFGLAGMRERARLLGGAIAVDSTPGTGTCIVAELPLVLKA